MAELWQPRQSAAAHNLGWSVSVVTLALGDTGLHVASSWQSASTRRFVFLSQELVCIAWRYGWEGLTYSIGQAGAMPSSYRTRQRELDVVSFSSIHIGILMSQWSTSRMCCASSILLFLSLSPESSRVHVRAWYPQQVRPASAHRYFRRRRRRRHRITLVF